VKRRYWLALVTCLAIAGAAVWLGLFIDSNQRHTDFCSATRAELETLANKRPPGLTRNQWDNVVLWTINAHGNTLPMMRPLPLIVKRRIPRAEMDRFQAELRQRLSGPVDLATIDWIWDEFERLAPDFGPEYSRRYRPTSPEKVREFE
jgi:hypothetical protein